MCYYSCKLNIKKKCQRILSTSHALALRVCGQTNTLKSFPKRTNPSRTEQAQTRAAEARLRTLVAPPLVPTQPISALLLRAFLRPKWWRPLALRPAFSSIALLLPLQNVKGNAAGGGGSGP